MSRPRPVRFRDLLPPRNDEVEGFIEGDPVGNRQIALLQSSQSLVGPPEFGVGDSFVGCLERAEELPASEIEIAGAPPARPSSSMASRRDEQP